MDVRRVVAGIGRTFISAGVLILLFVAYQLWGTGLSEARAQDDLKEEFSEVLASTTTTTTMRSTTTSQPGATTTTVAPPPAPPPTPRGAAVAIMAIPSIGLEKAVVEGVGVSDLKKGPGHYPSTPLPGQPGNSAIAGHRTTYGAPFYRLDELRQGDPILVTTRQGKFRYEVTETKVVSPKAVEVLAPTSDNRLTLTTCHPRFSARQRLIVVATLVGEAADPPPAPVEPVTEPVEPDQPEELPDEEVVDEGPEEEVAFDEAGLSGDPAARAPALLWGLAAAAVWIVTWLVARRWRRWPAYLLGTPLFLVVLFLFFENVARLFPANI